MKRLSVINILTLILFLVPCLSWASHTLEVNTCGNDSAKINALCKSSELDEGQLMSQCSLNYSYPSKAVADLAVKNWKECIAKVAERRTSPCLRAAEKVATTCTQVYGKIQADIERLDKEVSTGGSTLSLMSDPSIGPKIRELDQLRQQAQKVEKSVGTATEKYASVYKDYSEFKDKFISPVIDPAKTEEANNDEPKPAPKAVDDRATGKTSPRGDQGPNLKEIVGDTSGLQPVPLYSQSQGLENQPARLGSQTQSDVTQAARIGGSAASALDGGGISDLPEEKKAVEISKTKNLEITAQSSMSGFNSTAGQNMKPKSDEKPKGILASAFSKIQQTISGFFSSLGAGSYNGPTQNFDQKALSAKQLKSKLDQLQSQRIPAQYQAGSRLSGPHSNIFKKINDRYFAESKTLKK